MPRARVPNASLIASADLPILPWLAPSIFAESPVPGRSGRHGEHGRHGRLTRAQKETDRSTAHENSIRAPQCTSQGQKSAWSCAASYATTRGWRNLQPLSLTNKRGQASSSILPPSPSDIRYAGIASFARQQARSYASTTSVTRQQARSHASTTAVARKVVCRTTRLQTAHRRTPTVRTSLTLRQRRLTLAAHRQRLLAREQKRRTGYVSRQSSASEETLLGQGQYRSLRRRLLNLRQWDATEVDLRAVDGACKGRLWLIRAFAALDRKVHWRMKRHTQHITIKHHPHCARWSSMFFQATGEKKLQWMNLDAEKKTSYAQRLLIYLLDRRPGRALLLIQALADVPHLGGVPPEALADALDHLAKIHVDKLYAKYDKWHQDPEALKQDFLATFSRLFRQTLSGHPNICSQELLFNVVSLATAHDLEAVFDMIIEARTRLGYDTLLHYANAFGEAGNFKYALKCLDEMKVRHDPVAWKRVIDRQRFRWSCAVILRKSMNRGQNYHDTPDIVAAFVRLGVKMDILLYNVVMHNAMEADDYATAFKVYNALNGNGLKPDAHTFSILLHGCTMQSNPASFHNFAEYCVEVAKETQDPWLATDYLYYLYVRHHNKSDPEQTLAVLWRAYLNLFSAKPLEPFVGYGRHGIRNAIDQQSSLPVNTLLEPSHVALYIMLQAEIEAALNVSNQRVLTLYSQFRLLAKKSSDQALINLAQKPVIWNAFLLAFCQKQQFASASQLIKDMTDNSPQPNVYSWNIFMQAFFKTSQIQAAERVFEIMRNRGVSPDQYTYGVLLRGYAKAQLISRIGETMQHLDEEQQMDPGLLRALAKVVDRKKLMFTLEQARIRKERKIEEKTKQDAEREEQENAEKEEREKKWREPPQFTALISGTWPVQDRNPKLRAQNPNDAGIQYKKLQKQLGIIPESPITQDDVQRPPKPVSPFGASLGFKSMLPASQTRVGVEKGLPKFEIKSVFRPGGEGKK